MSHEKTLVAHNNYEGGIVMEKSVKKEIIMRIISIITTSLFLVFATWIWFSPTRKSFSQNNAAMAMNNMKTNQLEFVDLTEGIHLENAYPVSDEVGSSISPYEFQITNHSNTVKTFTIAFVDDYLTIANEKCKSLDNNYLRYILSKNNDITTPIRNISLDGDLYVDTLQPQGKAIYSIKFWIDQDAGNEIMNTHFHKRVAIVNEK